MLFFPEIYTHVGAKILSLPAYHEIRVRLASQVPSVVALTAEIWTEEEILESKEKEGPAS